MLRAEYSFQFRGRISLQLTEPARNLVLSSEIKNNDFEITAERREGPMRSPTSPTRLPIENGIMAQEPRFRSVRKNSNCDHSHHASFVMKGVENSHPSHIPRQIMLINTTHDRCRVLIPALRISPLNRSSCVFFNVRSMIAPNEKFEIVTHQVIDVPMMHQAVIYWSACPSSRRRVAPAQ